MLALAVSRVAGGAYDGDDVFEGDAVAGAASDAVEAVAGDPDRLG